MSEMGEVIIQQGRSLAETPTYLVASLVTVMVFVCLLVERSIYRFGKWLKKTRRKALFASLEKIKEELMLLGLISLLLAQCARGISEICVNSSLFSSKFYLCSEKDYGTDEHIMLESTFSSTNSTNIPPKGLSSNKCGEGREPFVSYQGLEQLHRFLFVLGITHVLYSCVAVGLAMSKIYSWRKWESQASLVADGNPQGIAASMRLATFQFTLCLFCSVFNLCAKGSQRRAPLSCYVLLLLPIAKKNKVMRRQTTFVFHHTSHPWSRSRVLIWMLCFLRQFRSSIQKSDYLALRLGFVNKHKLPPSYNFHKYMVRSMEDELHGILGISWPLWGYAIVCIFINIHGLNIYFWLSFIPAILVMLVGTKLQHVVSSLALEIMEQKGPSVVGQVKPRDDLFWFGKPEILLRLIQFIIFQNAFEMATFIWSMWGFKKRSCFVKNHWMIAIRLASGILVQFWCSYSTVPLNVIVTQMGSRCKKALVAESVRESLHSWCKRVKEKSRIRDSVHSHTTRSVCSLESTVDERDEITVASDTLSRSSSMGSLNQVTVESNELVPQPVVESCERDGEYSFRVEEYLSDSLRVSGSLPPTNDEDDSSEEGKVETLFDLFHKI